VDLCLSIQSLIDLAQAIKRLYINMIDLEHEGHLGSVDAVQRFPTEVALSEYTKKTGNFYERGLVPEESLLRFLLRQILNPRPEKAGKDRTGNHKRKGGKQKGIASNQSEKRCGWS